MFTVAEQKLKFVVAVIFAIFPNTLRDYCLDFSGTWISCRDNAPNFLVPMFGAQFVFHLYFAQSLLPCSAVCLRQLTCLFLLCLVHFLNGARLWLFVHV